MSIDIGLTFAHYEVLSRLGAGGMGEVFRARDLRLDRYVAIKALPAPFSRDPDRLSRFVREAKILASLNHPGIGSIHGLEELPGGEHCLILELVKGISLAERLSQSRLPAAESFRLCGGIAEALDAAHQRGVIHRDLKPGNVMLTDRGGIKVLDFGLARQVRPLFPEDLDTLGTDPETFLEDSQSKTLLQVIDENTIEGTPGYMSPEQIRGEAQDQRTDIFSFGCVLFECLTGQRAFIGKNPFETMAAVLNGEPPWSALPGDTPEPIRLLLQQCLEKDVTHRMERIELVRRELKMIHGPGRVSTEAVSSIPNNLPRETRSFVGRERELSECAQLLEQIPLLTLTGIGGSGKTRLARRLAGKLLPGYPDGAWFVDLAPLMDPDRLVLTVASALGISEEPNVPLIQTLALHLKTRHALLVLDNCEQHLDACSRLVKTLLKTCTDLKIIATSRVRLGIEEERSLTVQSLSLPPREGERDVRAVLASDAGKLFVDRAREVDTGFELTRANAPAVGEICRRLDGIPLAIELAANRVKMLTVDQVRAKIDNRFRLLTAGLHEALPRHQTLHATIQWSYDHLTGGEQRLFRGLSVFNGGWTLSAATAVAGYGMDEFAVLDALTRLADKSLLVIDRESGPEARYTMLETVKHYAMERLVESGEETVIRDRYLDYYLFLAQEIDHQRLETRTTEWHKRVDRDLENFLSAHVWCDRAEGCAEKGLRLAFALRNYWLPRGTMDLGFRISVEALRREGAAAPSLERGKVLLTAGVLAYFTGRYAEGGDYLTECLSIMREKADQATLSTTLTGLALISLAQRQTSPAKEYLMEAIRLGREAGAIHSLSGALNTLGDVYRVEGKYEEATSAYEEAIEKSRLGGTVEDSAVSRCNLGRTWINRRNLARSRSILAELLGSVEEVDSLHVLWGILDVATGLAIALGQFEFATRIHGAADALLKRSNSRRDISDNHFLEPLLSRARESLGAEPYETIYNAGRESSHETILAEIRAWLPDDKEIRDDTDR